MMHRCKTIHGHSHIFDVRYYNGINGIVYVGISDNPSDYILGLYDQGLFFPNTSHHDCEMIGIDDIWGET